MSQPDVTVTFDYQEQDYDAFQTYFLSTAPYNRKLIRKWRIMCVLISALSFSMGVFWIVLGFVGDGGWTAAFAYGAILYGLGFGSYAFMWLPAQIRRASLRRIKKLRNKLGADARYGERSVTVRGDTFVCAFPNGATELKIQSMPEPVLTETHCFFLVDQASAYVVPLGGTLNGDLDALIARFRQVRAEA